MQGIFNSRDIIAEWQINQPVAVTIAAAFFIAVQFLVSI